jgi:hypothetical protein
MAALIATHEVIMYGVAERAFSPDKVLRIREVMEMRFFRACTGNDFYVTLKADVKDWSGKLQWTAGSYSIGNMVWWQDNLWESTANSNTDEPSPASTKWKDATKFNTAEYDTLWKLYLRPIIANDIIRMVVPFETTKFTGKGAVVMTEDGANTSGADAKSLDYALRNLVDLTAKITDEMREYILDQQELYNANPATGWDYATAGVQFVNCDSCKTQSMGQTRRFAFKW